VQETDVGKTIKRKDIISVLVHNLEELLGRIEIYHKKILLEREPEDLHRFRVALRHSVVLMGEFSFLDKSGILLKHRKAFKKLINLSNMERDLDIFKFVLEALEKHQPAGRNMYEQLFGYIEKKREHVHKVFLSYLKSRECIDIFSSWRKYLYTWQQDKNSVYAHTDAKSMSAYVIAQRLPKIRTQIEVLEKREEHMEEKLHELRISYKKLRYLLETFGYLFDKKKIEKFVKEIKKIQDTMGAFHDSYQQKIILKEILESVKEKQLRNFIEKVLLAEISRAQEKEIVKAKKTVERFLQQEEKFRKLFL